MGNTNTKPFGVKDKIGYMCGDIANDFTFIFASSYVMVFYTKVMGVSAGMVGTMFLLARCLDAFTDIGMGRIVDNSKPTKNGRIRPWILRMCAFVALASFMMYQSFLVDAPYAAKVAYMFITYILWGSIFYTSVNIPYGIHGICYFQRAEGPKLLICVPFSGRYAGRYPDRYACTDGGILHR